VGGEVRLTGFGLASRLPRERPSLEPPEELAGTLAYMSPEQTGRMNRSIDFRSDLYALGVTLYQMLTGVLPFAAADPMEWVHCHVARQPIPPAERVKAVPKTVSAIIMKLLAKTAEKRYQTARGIERDLRRCLAEWEARRVDAFQLGVDSSDRLLIPEGCTDERARSSIYSLFSIARHDWSAGVGILSVLGIGNRQWSMSCIRSSLRHAGSSRPPSSISTSMKRHMRPSKPLGLIRPLLGRVSSIGAVARFAP
jgi:serine/threonine protein kinase